MDIVWGGIIGPDPSGCEVTLVNNGSDWGARINAADVALGAKAGAICCYGGGNIASQIILNTGASSLRTLRFGAGTWTNSNTAETILPHDNVLIEGNGWDTIIQEPPGNNVLSYFLMKPYATKLSGDAQAANISVRNIQLSGVGITKAMNSASSTMITGLLNGGLYQNIWFNTTHSIGLSIGESNPSNLVRVCQDVTIRQCQWTSVGGGVPPNYPGGGGVSFAILDGNRILLDSCTFIDARGNAVIDLEPNTTHDPVTNVTITNNFIDQRGTTGDAEPFVYGVATHGQGGTFGPITISNNKFYGAPYQDPPASGNWYPTGLLYTAVYLNFSGVNTNNHDVENNDIQWTGSAPIVLADSANNTIRNNHIIGPNADLSVAGGGSTNNLIDGNYVASMASSGSYHFGISETGLADYNTFTNNQTTKTPPVTIVGAHSTQSGNTTVARPPYP